MMLMRQQTEPSASSSSAELQLVLRHPDDARTLTEQQLGWLQASLREDPRYAVEDILRDVAEDCAQLWQVGFCSGRALALLVTRLVWYPRGCAFQIHLCGGENMAEWLHLLPELEQHARNLGCKFVELMGRRGWQRALPEYGFRGVGLSKELT